MNLRDIKQSILYQIDDIEDIENICYTNHLYHEVCSSKDFWIQWYNKQRLNFPGNTYKNAKDYIIEYKYLINKTNELINNMIYGFRNNTSLYFNTDVSKMDIDTLAFNLDDDLLDFLDAVAFVRVDIKYNYTNKNYTIIYTADDSFSRYIVDKHTIFNFIYNLLLAGVTIRKIN